MVRMQLSLVAFYGEKDEHPLWQNIEHVQRMITKDIGDLYIPYTPERIHGTIIGLESEVVRGKIINKNYYTIENREREMDLRSLIDSMQNTDLLPVTIRIGGFRDVKKDTFSSRSETPFRRSFNIRGDTVLAMGWPYSGGQYVTALDTLRRSFNGSGYLHKYHTPQCPFDNDFYLVLGTLRQYLQEDIRNNLQSGIRNEFSKMESLNVPLRGEDISIIRYHDTKLFRVEVFPLLTALKQIDKLTTCISES